jgi:acetylornithine/succinyldiaminopimelate/putrescine aminotransferase
VLHTAPTEPQTASPSEVTFANGLLAVLVPDRHVHPERLPATLGRVHEVVGIVAADPDQATEIAARCALAAADRHSNGGLSRHAATAVAGVLASSLSPRQVAQATTLLAESELSTDEVVALHHEFKIPVSRLEDDLLPVRGDGALIHDSLGRTLIDLDSNYSATNLGNSNPEIARGLANQASLLISQKEDRIQVARARFLKEFTGLLPDELHCFYWQNSGGEAVDKSLKMAKAYTGHTGVIAFDGGFHGRTHGAVAVTHNPAYRTPFGLDDAPWVHFAPFNDLDAVEQLLASGAAKTVILELVQGEEAGIRPADAAFATGLRALCNAHGAVLICDEVQTGFGRIATGPGTWFACQVYGIVPDIIAIGKSFGGGYPVTAVVTQEHISRAMRPGFDGSTFGGNPMAMTAALIATRQMRELELPTRVVKRSQQLADGLGSIESPLVEGFRTHGLMVGIDLPNAETVHAVQELMIGHGAHSSLSTGATMRWMPPLVITEEQVEAVLRAFSKALDEVDGGAA